MGDVIKIRTKTWCQVCGNGYADENFMLGYCHGLPLIEVPWTKEDYENHRRREQAIKEIMSKKFDWD